MAQVFLQAPKMPSSVSPLFILFALVIPSLFLVTARSQEEDTPRYELHEIPYGTTFAGLPVGTVVVEEMNNKRQVVGRYSYNDPGITTGPVIRLWVYLPGADYGLAAGFHLIGTPGKRIELASINDEGLIGGAVSNYGDTRRYLQAFTIKVDGSDYSEFNFTGATDDSHIYDIANGGFVCGRAALTMSPPANRGQNSHAFIRNPDPHSHPNPFAPVFRQALAFAINSQGKAAVNFETATAGTIAALSDGESYTLLTPVPQEERFRISATDINEKNEVIGHYESYYNTSPAGTFLSLPAPAYGLPAGFHVLPFSGDSSNNLGRTLINDHGLIVTWKSGTGGSLWRRGTLHTFAEILPPETSGISSIVVRGLDNSGAILARNNSAGFLMLLPEELEVITVNDDRDLQDDDPDDGVIDVDPDEDGEQITLRAAIDYANEKAGRQRIVFDIPGGGIPTIQVGLPPEGENVMIDGSDPESYLGEFQDFRIQSFIDSSSKIVSCLKVTDPVEIDGSTQPGGWVELSGGDAAAPFWSNRKSNLGVNGLEIASGNCLVRGLVINSFYGVGMVLTGGGGNRIVGNRIGTDAAGIHGKGNTSYALYENSGVPPESYLWSYYSGGLVVNSPRNIIGGSTSSEGNLLSGNGYMSRVTREGRGWFVPFFGYNDLFITGSVAADNTVLGNFIGTDANGNKLASHAHYYIHLYNDPNFGDKLESLFSISQATGVLIGDGTTTGRNVIGGGLELSRSNNVQVRFNHIGINASKTEVLNEGKGGVIIHGCSDVLIHNNDIGTTAQDMWGIHTAGVTDLIITGNRINLLATPQDSESSFNLNGSRIRIGGTSPADANVIAHPHVDPNSFPEDGRGRPRAATILEWHPDLEDDIVIVGNQFVPNPTPGSLPPAMVIDWNQDGPTPASVRQQGSIQNYPRFFEAVFDGSDIQVKGELEVPLSGGTYHLDFYSVEQPLASGHGGLSMNYLGRHTITATVGDVGIAYFDFSVPVRIANVRRIFTATATRVDGGSTSEFARNTVLFDSELADADSDGIPDEEEQLLGDRNGDGILDSEQDHVSSLSAANGEPTTVEATPATAARQAFSGNQLRSDGAPRLENVMAETVGTIDAPRGYDYPHGLLSFHVADLSVGASVSIRLILKTEAAVQTLWTLADDDSWFAMTGVTLGEGELTFTITDGGAGDYDGVANGRIVVALGPASALPPEPPLELAIRTSADGEGMLLSWPAAALPAELEFSPDLSSWWALPYEWAPRLNGEQWEIYWPLSPSSENSRGFFRLRER